MRYQENMENRIGIFEDTIGICEREPALLHGIRYSREHTVLWKDFSSLGIERTEERYKQACKLEVTDERLPDVTRWIKENRPDYRIGIGCHIDAWHPGGSVIRGGEGQEETLCRYSTLYPCLNTDYLGEEYYTIIRSEHSGGYADRCIYIPDIVCFREDTQDGTGLALLRQEDWVQFDAICGSLPDISKRHSVQTIEDDGKGKDWNYYIDGNAEFQLEQWLGKVLRVAAMQRIDVLLMEEFEGFTSMESIIKKALQEYEHSFQAVYLCRSRFR